MKITSVNNDLIKEYTKLQQRKYRDEKKLFLIEGEKSIDEAISFGIDIVQFFVLDGYDKYNNYDNVIVTTESILSKLSTTVSSPKCIAIAKQPERFWEKDFKHIVLLEDIKDAGNLGTIIRTSAAFNIDAIILYGDTVDLYNPKCVRASVGNLWKLPVFKINSIDELKKMCSDYIPVATLPKSNNSVWLKDFSINNKLLIMFGTESCGLSKELTDYATEKGKLLTIEMNKDVESLNLSISAAVILYKIFTESLN